MKTRGGSRGRTCPEATLDKSLKRTIIVAFAVQALIGYLLLHYGG